ncbi:MAG TPA: acetate--CoA ligase family protein [Dissulfurispiraceae bacterium]|nr:acetate--CoA ligase family protein [Dissulfurispiraceae bacterium]
MLETLFNPESIAVIGASKDPKKVGYAVAHNLIQFNFGGDIYPINPSADCILGLKAYPAASAVGKTIGLAVIAVPARAVPDALLDCAVAGAGAAVILSAGFKEAGAEGIRLEERLREISIKHDIRILGPNCLGIINTANHMNASFAGGMLPKGKTAFFSQSGALGIAILDWALGNNMGFSKFISLGNKTDLNETDFIEYFSSDPDTDIILGYIEDVIDGKRFLDVARKATKVKPIILIKSGGTEAGARAASSHTGALAGSETAFNAAFKQTGIIRAHGIEELFDTAVAFGSNKLPAGNRLLIITNAGGPGILAADMAERTGVKLPIMTKETIDAIAKMLPSNASLFNPVDIIGDATSERYAVVLNNAIKDPNIDGILVILTPQAMTDVENTADIIIRTGQDTDKPIISSFIGEVSVRQSIEKMKAKSMPSFSYPETAVKSFKKLCDFTSWKNRAEELAPVLTSNKDAVKDSIDALLKEDRFEVGDDIAMNILARYGFPFPERALARTAKEAAAIAERIGFPLVMKISSPDILHKTDVGGVKLDINSEIAAEDAFTEITTNAKRFMPDAMINGVMLYEMIKGGKEVILGVTYDRTFGHMLMFGLGGIYVEILKDVSFRIAPLTRSEAVSMISEIRTSALLRGARGEKPVDIDAIVDGILKLSSIVTDFPVIRELDINPLVVLNKGAFALDARIIFKRT